MLSARTLAVASIGIIALLGGWRTLNVYADFSAVSYPITINEFVSNPSSGSEWVELYNGSNASVDISGWKIQNLTFSGLTPDGTATTTIHASTIIPPHGFYVQDVTGLNNKGDTISLYGTSTPTALEDTVTYGVVASSTADVSAPPQGESAYRTTDGGDTWAVGSPTKGFTNVPQPTVVNISTVAELRYAIEHQVDGQTWNIAAGTYGLAAFNDITTQGETGWYFPITVNNLTIKGIGNPTIYGTGYTTNGNWSTQNLISIFGNNVTIDGVTLMPKVEPNKTIEVLGSNATIKNVTIEPNTLTDQSEYASIPNPQDRADELQWGGSIYFNNATGTQTLENVTIQNGGISDHAPSATLTLANVNLNYSTNVDWINGYRLATHGYTVNGTAKVVYHVDSTLNNIDSVIASLQNGDTIELDSNITTGKQITIAKDDVTINGNGHTISPSFAKTDNSNNSALGIDGNGVTVNNLIVDGTNGLNLHGINVFNANGITLNGVTVQDNAHSGLNIVSSDVTVNNITTKNNGWHGIDVDLSSGTVSNTSATLTVNGTSTQAGEAGGDIYVDDTTKNVSVVDTNNQYSITTPVVSAHDAVYSLIPVAPTNLTLKTTPGNSDITNGGYTNSYGVTANWNAVEGADHYKYEYWNDISGSLYNLAHPYIVTTSTTTLSGVFNQGEGVHHIAVSACDSTNHCSTHPATFTVTYDHTAPGAPTITAPGARTWHQTAPIVDSWTAVPDAGGIEKYQIAYNYDDGHSFTGSTCPGVTMTGVTGFVGCRDVSGTSRNHSPASNEQGGVTIWVRAIDNAGNIGPWSHSVHYFYDHTAPTTDINVSVSGTKLTVSGDASDNLALNRVYVQLVSRQDGHRYGGTTINLIPDGETGHWTKTYDIKSLGYPYGDFAANVEVVDMAGNSYNPGWTADYLVGEPVPPKVEDTTVPSVAITSAVQSPVNVVSFDGSISDNDLNYYYCYLTTNQTVTVGNATYTPGQEVENTRNSSCETTWAKGQNSFTGTLGGFDVAGLPTGNYTINLVARDIAGNSNASTPATYRITINHPVVTTNVATNITASDATLNATNGPVDATGYLFWVSTSPIDTSNPNKLSPGAVRTNVLGSVAADGSFSATLSSLVTAGVPQNMLPITPNTTYYYVAWVQVGGTWYPGAVRSFVTGIPAPVIISPVTGSATTTADFKQVAWTSVPGTGVTYVYQWSNSEATTTGGAFASSGNTYGPLTTTYIATPNAPLGTYYIHVMAKDAQGNESAWSPIVKVTVEKVVAPVYTYAYATTTVQAANLASTDSEVATDPSKWYFFDVGANTRNNNLGSFVDGPGTAPLGSGSAQMGPTAGQQLALVSGEFSGWKLANFAKLQYSSYSSTGAADSAVSLRFDVTTGNASPTTGSLVYAPQRTHTIKAATWQTWNPMDDSQTGSSGNWSFTGAGSVGCSDVVPCTWTSLIKTYPNMQVDGKVYLQAGPAANDFSGNVDDFAVAVKNGTDIAQTTYDFEPTAPVLVSATTGTGGGANGILGDLNGDGHVNFLDFALMMGAFGETGTDIKADLNGDHVVNAADLAILLGNWTGS